MDEIKRTASRITCVGLLLGPAGAPSQAAARRWLASRADTRAFPSQ